MFSIRLQTPLKSKFQFIRRMSSQSPCICVFYSSVEGQSEKIANHMKEVIEKGNKYGVSIHNTAKLPKDYKIENCKGALVGGSVHSGLYNPDLTAFVKTHIKELQTLPTGFFSVNLMTLTDQKIADGYISKFLKETKWNPSMAFTFAGALRFTQYGFFTKWSMGYFKLPEDKKPKDNKHDYEYTNWESVDHFVDDFVKVVEKHINL